MRTPSLLLALVITACQFPWSGIDPLTVAVRNGDVAAVHSLARSGADLNRPAGVNGWPPLMHAIHKHQRATLEELLAAGADVNRADPNGMTPLMMAAGYGYDDLVALLLARGADPQRRSSDGSNALDYALTRMNDIDRFTLLRCQDPTVQLLSGVGVTAKASSVAAAKAKCSK